MSAKLVRCLEGHIFNLAESEACPTCGAGVASNQKSAQKRDGMTDDHLPKPKPDPTPKPQPKPKPDPKPWPKPNWNLMGKVAGIIAGVAVLWLLIARLMAVDVVHQAALIEPDAQTRAIAQDLKLSNSALVALEVQVAYMAYRKGEYGTAKSKFERLAEAGSPLGQYYLADILARGLGAKIDDGEAVALLKKSAASGFSLAQVALAQRYETGMGVAQDMAKAQEYYLAAALQGNETAKAGAQRVGVDLLNAGLDMKGVGSAYDQANYAVAFPRAEELAGQGMSYAEYLLGLMHYLGYGTERSEEQAVHWLRSAGEKSEGFAQWMMGRISAQGAQGVEQNIGEAAVWYRLSLYNTFRGPARDTLKGEIAKFWPQVPPATVNMIDALLPPID